ncbi:MAG: class I tRNA ligase family protein [Chitinophagales bacterium]
MEYQSAALEQFSKDYWSKNNTYRVENNTEKPKYYVLDMFPYPSGSGLHVGHPLGYIASDIYARYKRQSGFNVLHPMGYDAFGLPAEQYAIQTGQHPAKTTEDNIARYKKQLDSIGFSFDWDRMVKTSDPEYYKWTQWIFIQLFNSWYAKDENKAQPIEKLKQIFESEGNKGLNAATACEQTFGADEWNNYSEKQQADILMQYRLAFQAEAMVNWCPALGTVLANDEVVNGVSERGGHPVMRKSMRQWFLRITAYTERLLNGLDQLDWPESLKEQQRNWIGRSEGAQAFFHLANSNEKIEVFTTRPDTIFGVTFMVLAPEHPLVKEITRPDQQKEVGEYLEYVSSRSDLERQSEVKKVTGAFTGAYAVHPFTDEKIPVWIGEYVLMGYGTGAIMAVPSDDDRDKAFAEKFGIEIIPVVDKSEYPDASSADKVGKIIHSDFLNGMEVPAAIDKAISVLEEKALGERKINYRLKDANFSRQRYWGEPFPVYYENGIAKTLPESELPLELPKIENYKPTETGEPPLGRAKDWTYEGHPLDLNTMPGYAGSSWYFLRYMNPDFTEGPVDPKAEQYWKQVDFYIGGAEHAVGHLMYARFWQMFLYDIGKVSIQEPFKKLINQGMIQGMSALIRSINTVSGVTRAGKDVDLVLAFSHDEFNENKKPDIDNVKKWIESKGYEVVNLSSSVKIGDYPFESISRVRVDICYLNSDSSINDLVSFEEYLTKLQGKKVICIPNSEGKFICEREVEKMSKSKFNVVNPDDIIEQYGADVFRMYEMFLGPIDVHKPWNTQGIDGVAKFMRKFWRLIFQDEKLILSDGEASEESLKTLHKTIKKVREDVERLSFNTCVSAFMVCVNELNDQNCHKREILKTLSQLIAPFAPHTSEYLWQEVFAESGSVTDAPFSDFEEKYLKEDSYAYPINIGKKVRAKVELPLDMGKEAAEKIVLENPDVQKWTEGKEIKRFVFVPGRIVNIVVG